MAVGFANKTVGLYDLQLGLDLKEIFKVSSLADEISHIACFADGLMITSLNTVYYHQFSIDGFSKLKIHNGLLSELGNPAVYNNPKQKGYTLDEDLEDMNCFAVDSNRKLICFGTHYGNIITLNKSYAFTKKSSTRLKNSEKCPVTAVAFNSKGNLIAAAVGNDFSLGCDGDRLENKLSIFLVKD